MNIHNEILQNYDRTKKYLDLAIKFEDHADKPWVRDNTLARWLYIGSTQAVNDFEKNDEEYLQNKIRNKTISPTIRDDIKRLRRILDAFAEKLLETFPEDKLIQQGVQK